jgi:hypothetical protein
MWSNYNCYICESKEVSKTDSSLCVNCEKYKNLCKIYTPETIVKSLETIFVRDNLAIEKRTEVVATKVITRSKSDKLYINKETK